MFAMKTTVIKSRGFSLIELLVVITIIGIIAGIAYPNYMAYLVRANRAAAKQFMLSISSREEQFLVSDRAYANWATLTAGGFPFPAELTNKYANPPTIITAGKDCNNVDLPPTGYTVTLTAIGSQTSDGNLCLDSVGNKTPAAKWSS